MYYFTETKLPIDGVTEHPIEYSKQSKKDSLEYSDELEKVLTELGKPGIENGIETDAFVYITAQQPENLNPLLPRVLQKKLGKGI